MQQKNTEMGQKILLKIIEALSIVLWFLSYHFQDTDQTGEDLEKKFMTVYKCDILLLWKGQKIG